MAKPSQLPQWATNPGKTFEPDSTRKANGHEIGSRPPARVQNWWQNLVYQWVQYLDSGNFEGRITATQGFEAGADEHITVVDGGRFKHGTIYRQMSFVGGSFSGVDINGKFNTTNGLATYQPINLQLGDRIRSITMTANRTVAGNRMSFTLMKNGVSVDTSNISTDTAGDQYLYLDFGTGPGGLPAVYDGNDIWYLRFNADVGSFTNNYILSDLRLFYDRP